MRLPWNAISLFLLFTATLAVAGDARAQTWLRFEIDPTRSSIAFESGELGARFGTESWAYAPMQAQVGTSAVPLSGAFVLAVVPDPNAPTDAWIESGTTDVRPANATPASPAAGAAPGSSPAALGVVFEDAATGLQGELALRDLVFAIAGSFQVFPNGAGPNGLSGNLGWVQARSRYDLTTNVGLEGSFPIARLELGTGFVFGDTQLTEVSTGIYEVMLPFSFSLGSYSVPGPVSDASFLMTLTGEIVATTDVPEPGFVGALSVACAGLLVLGRRRAGR